MYNFKLYNLQMIPKKIHYIWLGKKNKSRLTMMCINSWRRNLIGYEIIEWNEDNLPIDEIMKNNRFFRECYKSKIWAFVSDYLRLYILYNYGGIYLDTDVEVIKDFDILLNDEMFIGYEDNKYIGTGIIGAKRGNSTIKCLLDFYNEDIWKVDFYNNPIIFTYVKDNKPDIFKNCKIYDKNYFSPFSPNKQHTLLIENKNTYSIHWYTGNWNMSRKGYVFLNTKHIENPILRFISKIRKNIGYIKKKYLN